MELPDADDRTYGKVLSLKQSVMASVLTATARVRDGLLRPANEEGLDDLLALARGSRPVIGAIVGGDKEVTAEFLLS